MKQGRLPRRDFIALTTSVTAALATPTALSQAATPTATTSDSPGWRRIYRQDFTEPVPMGGFRPNDAGLLRRTSGAFKSYGKSLGGYPDGWGSETEAIYRPSRTVEIKRSRLYLRPHSVIPDEGGQQLLGAAVHPVLKGRPNVRRYGRYRYRMRTLANGPHLGVCALLWPADDQAWPLAGEIDFVEGDLQGPLSGFHHLAGTDNEQREASRRVLHPERWHTYTIEWLPDRLRFWVDDRRVYSSSDRVPSDPMRFVIQVGANQGSPDDATRGRVEIAWITIDRPA